MTEHYSLAGRVMLAADAGLDERARASVAAELDPFSALPADGPPDVELMPAADRPPAVTDLQNAAGDTTVTAWDGERLQLRLGDHWCRLPDLSDPGALKFELQAGFPLARAFGPILRPALQLALLRRGFATVHGTAVELDGAGLIVAGWSESGKTETALALMEDGARFLSDKWTVVGEDGTMSAFPVAVGVRRWVLPHLPRLRAALPARSRAQLGAAAVADVASRPVRKRPRGRVTGLAADTLSHAVGLADRASLSPSEVRAAYGQEDDPGRHVPVRCVAMLTTVEGDRIAVRETRPDWAAARLARSAAYERRPWFALQERARYAAPEEPAGEGPEEVIERERDLLRPVLSATRLVSVEAPFPVDPRRVAEALAPYLSPER
jgi:hypothetical protein